jgi:hypothetical protein
MANITPFTSNWLMAASILLITLTACEPKYEYYPISEEGLSWFPTDTTGYTFQMRDSNYISRWYKMHTMERSFYHNNSGLYGGKNTESEIITYTYKNNLSIKISSYSKSEELRVLLEDLTFDYDFKTGNLTYICSESYNKRTNFKSTAEILEEVIIGEKLYKNVLHVSQKDFPNVPKYSITDIYYAKGVGIVKYSLKDGPDYVRNSMN